MTAQSAIAGTGVLETSAKPYVAPLSAEISEGMPLRRWWGDDIVPLGFAMTVGVWICAYLSRMPLVHALAQVTVSMMLGAIFAGGFFAARFSRKGILGAVYAGAISGLLDILIIGSMIHPYMQSHNKELIPSAALWIGGSLLCNTLVAVLGGGVGRLFPSKRRAEINWTSFFALVLCTATLPLITAGGLVTSFHAGLAVPDWPTSANYLMFTFPLTIMQSDDGQFYEHSHRLMGSLVGLTVFFVGVQVLIADRRRWVKILAGALFVAVGVQGIMGGLRVTDKSITLAITHGIFAQIVFAAMVATVAITSRAFRQPAAIARPGASSDRALSLALIAFMIVQLLLGAMLRHKNEYLLLHISMAGFVLLLTVAAGVRAWGLEGNPRPVVRAGIAILIIVGIQICLGISALIFRPGPDGTPKPINALLATAHQANGALLLAIITVLGVWTWRLIGPASSACGR